jgi:hypothetical protein
MLERQHKDTRAASSQPSPPRKNLKRALPPPTEWVDAIISYAKYYSTELDVSESCLQAPRTLSIYVPLADIKAKEQEQLDTQNVRRAIRGAGISP